MHPKVKIVAVVGAVVTALIAIIPNLGIDPAVAGGIVTVLTTVAGYLKGA